MAVLELGGIGKDNLSACRQELYMVIILSNGSWSSSFAESRPTL